MLNVFQEGRSHLALVTRWVGGRVHRSTNTSPPHLCCIYACLSVCLPACPIDRQYDDVALRWSEGKPIDTSTTTILGVITLEDVLVWWYTTDCGGVSTSSWLLVGVTVQDFSGVSTSSWLLVGVAVQD